MENSDEDKKKLQKAWVEFAVKFEPNFYVTLTDPTEPHLMTMREKLGKLCGRIDRFGVEAWEEGRYDNCCPMPVPSMRQSQKGGAIGDGTD